MVALPAGLEGVLKAFWSIVDDVKRKPYDLLDFSRTQFDRDYLEFNVNIHDLEISLQAFINSSFENISSTQHALSLLAQFKAILLRESLREELDSKVQVRHVGQHQLSTSCAASGSSAARGPHPGCLSARAGGDNP